MRKLILLIPMLLAGVLQAQLTLPIDFESTTVTYSFTDFDGGNSTVVANPSTSGINTSANCGQMVKNTGQPWGGSFLTLDAPIDFSVNKTFKMKVLSPRVGARVLLKVENLNDGSIFFEKEESSTVANAWEELTFDYSAINTSQDYQKIVLIWDLGNMGDGSSNYTFQFDDIMLTSSGGPVLSQIDLPITFEDTAVDYTLSDFGGNFHFIVPDPTNASNTVAEINKDSTAQLWAGTTLSTANGLASTIPFSVGNTFMNVAFWSPDANIPVRLKAEDKNDPTKSVETEAMTTVAGQWEILTFDFSNEAMGTAAINYGYTYNMVSIFPNFGTDGQTAGFKTYYVDDVMFGPAVSIENALIEGLRYFPNPASDRIHIEAVQDLETVIVYDMMGREVLNRNFASNLVQLDLANLENGVYLVKVASATGTGSFRLIKE